jgi:hypothetical protein
VQWKFAIDSCVERKVGWESQAVRHASIILRELLLRQRQSIQLPVADGCGSLRVICGNFDVLGLNINLFDNGGDLESDAQHRSLALRQFDRLGPRLEAVCADFERVGSSHQMSKSETTTLVGQRRLNRGSRIRLPYLRADTGETVCLPLASDYAYVSADRRCGVWCVTRFFLLWKSKREARTRGKDNMTASKWKVGLSPRS